jgi:hypothetical protein
MEYEPLALFQGFKPLFESLSLDSDPDPHTGEKSDPHPLQIKIRIRIRIKAISRIRIRIKLMRIHNNGIKCYFSLVIADSSVPVFRIRIHLIQIRPDPDPAF